MDEILKELTRQHNERVELVFEDRATYAAANEQHLKATASISRYLLYRGVIETCILLVLMWSVFK